MSIKKENFAKLENGDSVELYTITNKNGASVCLQTLGAGIHSLFVPDKNGVLADVVLGFDNVSDYVNPDYGYQGLTVGRWANRIRDGKFTFGGVTYNTPKNQGTWTLHGGGKFSFTVWETEKTGDNFVTFKKFSPDMEDGFPGNFTMRVTYTFDDDNTLKIDYSIISDKDTVANPTNHTYFNLSGDNSKTIEDHYLLINADKFTETDSDQLPTGELGDVKGTMMDFTSMHKIGDKIDEPFRAIIDGVGYDNNYCLYNKEIGKMSQAAVLFDKASGRKMEVFTDLPGIQLYCGGWLDKNYTAGKNGSIVKYRRGVALETQFYPDSVNYPDIFPVKFVKANEEFKTTTEFCFTTE
ncbi:MAG: galactose mutarotase [Clostridiales bacterium]|nr:galactose mutarotase [Clostridiales bacterium]